MNVTCGTCGMAIGPTTHACPGWSPRPVIALALNGDGSTIEVTLVRRDPGCDCDLKGLDAFGCSNGCECYKCHIEADNRQLHDEVGRLRAVLVAARRELDRHGHGDFHYTEPGWRDPNVLAALAAIDEALFDS